MDSTRLMSLLNSACFLASGTVVLNLDLGILCTVHSRITLQKNLPKLRNLANESNDCLDLTNKSISATISVVARRRHCSKCESVMVDLRYTCEVLIYRIRKMQTIVTKFCMHTRNMDAFVEYL